MLLLGFALHVIALLPMHHPRILISSPLFPGLSIYPRHMCVQQRALFMRAC
jgi:hypothetical protein